MKTLTFEGEISEYQGKALPKPIKFSGSYDAYENVAEAKEDWPSETSILKSINNKRLTAAKQAEYQKHTADLRKEYEDSPEFKFKNLLASLVAAGKTEQEARGIAESIMPAMKGK